MNDPFDAAAASVAGNDPMDAAAGAVVQGQKTALRTSLYSSLMANPDMEARATKLSRQSGLPVDVVSRNFAEVDRDTKLNEFDRVLENSPKLGQWLSDQNNAKIAHDDSPALSGIETALSKVWSMTRSAGAGVSADISSGTLGLLETGAKNIAPMLDRVSPGGAGIPISIPGLQSYRQLVGEQNPDGFYRLRDIFPENPLRRIAAGIETSRKGQQALANKIAGEQSDGFVESAVSGGFRSFGQMAPSLAATVMTGNPGFAVASAAALSGSQSATKAMDKGLSPQRAALYGAADAGVEAVTEALPVGALLKNLKAGSGLLKTIGTQIATNVPTEMIATAWQGFNEYATLNPDKPFTDFLKTLPEAEAQTIISTITTSLLTAGLGHGVNRMVNHANRTAQAQEAEQSAQTLNELNKLATASKLKERDPQTFQQLMQDMTNGTGAESVYVPAELLMQSEAGRVLAQSNLAVGAQIQEAALRGGDVEIPTADYLTHIAGTPLEGPMLEHTKFDPNGMTLAEAKEYVAAGGDQLARDFEAAIGDGAQADQLRQSRDIVQQKLLDELNTAGRFREPVNQSYATLLASTYASLGQRFGMTAEQMHAEFPLSVKSGMQDGKGVLEQQSDNLEGTTPQTEADDLLAQFDEAAIINIEAPKMSEQEIDDAEARFLSDAPAGSRYTRSTRLLARVRRASDRATAELRGNPEATRINDQSLGPFSGYETRAEIVSGPDPSSEVLRVQVFGKEQVEQGLSDDAALTFTVGKDGALIVNGPIPEGRTFTEFKKMGWADFAHAAPGAEAIGWTTITDPNTPGSPLPVAQLMPLLADVHARVREWRMEDYVGLHWIRATGAAGGLDQLGGDHSGTAVFFQGARASFNPATLTIALNKEADFSSFLHETGHFYLEMLAELSSRPNAPPQIQQDFQTIKDWFASADHDKALDLVRQKTEQLEKNAATRPELRESAKRGRAAYNWAVERGGAGYMREVAESFGNNDDLPAGFAFYLTTPYHEQFAESTERYFFEGKAPSLELANIFRTFRDWMVSVYKNLKELLLDRPQAGELSNDIRQVLDRMIATDDEIAVAQQARSMIPLFATAQEAGEAGVSIEEFAKLQAGDQEATALAEEQLQARSLKDLKWLSNAKGKEVARLQAEAKDKRAEAEIDARREVMSQPVYRAWTFLTGRPDKNNPESQNEFGKFDRAAIEAMYDESGLHIPNHLDALKMTKKEGMAPEVIADMFPEFSSADELIRAIAAATPPKQAIEQLTDDLMMERYGDLNSPERIDQAADEAIHNRLRMRVLANEHNALAASTGDRKLLLSAAQEYADLVIGDLTIQNIKPGQYASAETRAARNAEKAQRAGDFKTAAAEKRNQVINAVTTKAAYDAIDEVKKGVDKLKRIQNTRTSKARDADVVAAVRAVLGAYGIGEAKGKKAAEYLKSVEAYDPGMYQALAPMLQDTEDNAKPIREMKVSEFRALMDTVDAMWHLARRAGQMEIDGDLMDRQDAQDALAARLADIGIPTRVPGEGSAVTPKEEAQSKLRAFIAAARRMESWVDAKDGLEKVGPFRRYVFNPIKIAADNYRKDNSARLKSFRALLEPIKGTLRKGTVDAPELGYTFGKDTGGSAMVEILHAVLHTGNASNKRKLLLGRQWAVENEDGTLDTSRWDRFIARMIDEGKITKAHYDFAQSVWDLMESMKPLAQKAHRDAFGRYFDEVTAEPFQTPFGEYKGGYVPALMDSRVVKDAEARRLLDDENSSMAYAMPSTPKGFTKARTEINKPLLLDLRTLPQHINKVLLFSHMEMPTRDVRRVLAGKDVAEPLSRVDPAAMNSLITPWLNRSARQQVETPITGDAGLMRFLSTLRARSGMAAMVGNVSNAIQQIAGFSIAAVKVKPTHMIQATATFLNSPRKTAQNVAELSDYMATRMENEVALMTGQINDILLNPGLIKSGEQWAMKHGYFLQSAVDNVMGPIIWTAAWNQAQAENMSDSDSVQFANSVIRQTQGSTFAEDVSRIETGNAFVRLFTQFASYFNMQANLLGTEYSKVVKDIGLRKGMGRGLYVTMFGFYASAIVAEAVAQAFRGGPEDEEKDGQYLDDWLMALFVTGPMRNFTAMAPGVGQIATAALNGFNTKPYDDRISTSPSISMIESAIRAPFDVADLMQGEGNNQRTVRDVSTLISLTTGIPANVAARPIGYFAGQDQGKIAPTSDIDALRGYITGTASPESKQ